MSEPKQSAACGPVKRRFILFLFLLTFAIIPAAGFIGFIVATIFYNFLPRTGPTGMYTTIGMTFVPALLSLLISAGSFGSFAVAYSMSLDPKKRKDARGMRKFGFFVLAVQLGFLCLSLYLAYPFYQDLRHPPEVRAFTHCLSLITVSGGVDSTASYRFRWADGTLYDKSHEGQPTSLWTTGVNNKIRLVCENGRPFTAYIYPRTNNVADINQTFSVTTTPTIPRNLRLGPS